MTPPVPPDRRSVLRGGAAWLALAGRTAGAASPGDGAWRDFPHYWEACVGSDRAAVALRADWQRDLATAKAGAGFRSVRFHGLLDDEMGLVRSVGRDGPELDFLYVDAVFDAMLAIGVRPFVELSFMPGALASSANTIFWYRGNTSPPRDEAVWAQVIGGLARHLVARYGAAEVRTWRFEVWNEPNLIFWAGTQQEYFRFYSATARALKAVDPGLQVGGPSTAQMAWIGEFVDYCAASNSPLDFVSSHVYADDPQETLFGRDLGLPREQVIPAALRLARDRIAASRRPGLPLVISEWTSQNPAFIAETVSACAGLCDTLSFWTFSGIFEEHGPVRGYGDNRFGLLNQRSVPRPSFHAFQLLHRLGTQRMATADPSVLLTRRADGGLALLAWNLISDTDVSGATGNPAAGAGGGDLRDGRAVVKTIALPAAAAAARATITLVDPRRDPGDAAWRALGSPASPTVAEFDRIRRAAALAPPAPLPVAGGAIRVALPANAVALVEISP